MDIYRKLAIFIIIIIAFYILYRLIAKRQTLMQNTTTFTFSRAAEGMTSSSGWRKSENEKTIEGLS